MKNCIYCIVILVTLFSSGCYKDDCTYNPTKLTYVNNTINVINNFGKSPQVFNGDSISFKTYGISFKLNFIQSVDPDECNWIPYNAPDYVKIITLNNFNNSYPAKANITSAFSLLNKTDDLPKDLSTNGLGKYNYFLLNESPLKDTLQQFILISFDRYNDTASVDTTRAILIKR